MDLSKINLLNLMKKKGASVVISHHILEGKHEQYEAWLSEIAPICKSYPGHIDWQIIRPIPNLTYIYTVIIRFDTIENLKNWMASQDRKQLIEKARPLFAKDDHYYINSGLDFLFVSETEKSNPPARWKQYLVTWSAIFPLAFVVPLIILPILRMTYIPKYPVVDTLVVTGVIVWLMVYLVMPNYTKLIKTWLYK